MAPKMKVPIVNLAREFISMENELVEIFCEVGRSGQYVLGDGVSEFETVFAEFCDAKHAVSCANASDGLEIALKSVGVGPGDEVITAANSFISSGGAIAALGATPVFADVNEDMNIDPVSVEGLISKKTKVIMPVHLTGRPAPMREILALAKKYKLRVVEDAAQAVGATYYGAKVGALGDVGVFSLHPLKNLHVYGDGGAIVTNSDELNTFMLKYRNHGLRDRDHSEFWGRNSRLDTLQAKIATFKLAKIDDINKKFREIAKKYKSELSDIVEIPIDKDYEYSVYHNFVIKTDKRNELMDFLILNGIDVKVRYPVPLTLQKSQPQRGNAPNSEKIADRMLSLPIFPTIKKEEIEYVIKTIRSFFIAP